MKKSEILFVIVLVGGLLVPALIVKQYWLALVFGVFFVCFGIIEAIAVLKTGRSVSQKFWDYSKDHTTGAWIVLTGMLLAWLALLWHLGAKLF